MCRGLATHSATCLKSVKHKISLLLHKPEPQASDQKQKKKKTDATAAAAKRIPTPAEVRKWKESFSQLMSSQMGRTVFGKFLKSEYSEENMDFWVACENYKTLAPSKISTGAKMLYLQHVEADAPYEVNLDAETREETRQNLENACPFCFNKAQKMIYALMEKDSYRRFLKSKLIQDLCQTTTTKGKKEKQSCNCAANRQATPKQQADV